MGAILVTANPRSAPAELAGLVGQVRPRLMVTDPDLDGVMAAARGWGAGEVVEVARLYDSATRVEDPARPDPTTRPC